MIEIGAPLGHQLSWSHYVELLPYDNINKIQYYINIIEQQNLSIRKLRTKIKFEDYKILNK